MKLFVKDSALVRHTKEYVTMRTCRTRPIESASVTASLVLSRVTIPLPRTSYYFLDITKGKKNR